MVESVDSNHSQVADTFAVQNVVNNTEAKSTSNSSFANHVAFKVYSPTQLYGNALDEGILSSDESEWTFKVKVYSSTQLYGNALEECILPSDESEWTKLFTILRLKIHKAELSRQER